MKNIAVLLPGLAICELSQDREIVWANEAFGQLVGYSLSEMSGFFCLMRFRRLDCLKECALISREIRRPIRFVNRAGMTIHATVWHLPFSDGQEFSGGFEIIVPASEPDGEEIAEFQSFASQDPLMKRSMRAGARAAGTDQPIWLLGETGCRLEDFAAAVHAVSRRAEQPFAIADCSRRVDIRAMARDAGRGTLYLHEAGRLSRESQDDLLGILSKSEGPRWISSSSDAPPLPLRGDLSHDLFLRLCVVQIPLPPLRERLGDIGLLCERFLGAQGPPGVSIDPQAVEILRLHDWPGNEQEFRNALTHALAVCEGGVIHARDLPSSLQDLATASEQESERAKLRHALEEANGNIGEAAASLGISRTTFWRWRRLFGI